MNIAALVQPRLALALALAIVTWLAPSGSHAASPGPVETVTRYLELSLDQRCDELWTLYTKATQANLAAWWHRHDRERNDKPQEDSRPQLVYCWRIGTLKHDSVRVQRESADEAVVQSLYTSGSRLNPYRPYVEHPETFRLVREEGAWRIDLPPRRYGRPGWELEEVGPVDVFSNPKGNVFGHVVDASAPSRAPREGLDAVLGDPREWLKLLPQVASVETLGAAGGWERVRVVFAGWDRPLEMRVRYSGMPGRPRRRSEDMFVQWESEGGPRGPVKFDGEWRIRPHYLGARITMHVVLNPQHWPEELGGRMLSAQGVAQVIERLEGAARKR